MSSLSISDLRELSQQATKSAAIAKAEADRLKLKLETAACKKAGLSLKYLELIASIEENPISGGYGHRVFDNAIKKEVIKNVRGEIRHKGCSSNSYYELGSLGIQIMKDIHGDDWEYVNPAKRKEKR